MTQDTSAPALPAPENTEQAQPAPNESLAAMVGEAAALDGAPAAKESAQERAVAVHVVDTNKAEIHAILSMIRKAAFPIIGMVNERKAAMLSAVWSDEVIAAIADDGAKVLALHGVKLDNLASGFGPYVGLALSLGPASFVTYKVLKSPEPQPAQVVSDGQQQ